LEAVRGSGTESRNLNMKGKHMNQTRGRVMMVVAAMAAVLTLVGCGGAKRLGRYDLVVTADPSLRDGGTGRLPLVEVDLIGVAESDLGNWGAQGVDQHFSGENAVRNDAKSYTHTVTFSQDDAGAKVLKAGDPIWQTWQKRGVTHLYVFGSARTFRNTPGGPDRRKMSIPLTTDKWESGTRQIDIVLKGSGVDCATAQKVMK